jgi:hypothetical protein
VYISPYFIFLSLLHCPFCKIEWEVYNSFLYLYIAFAEYYAALDAGCILLYGGIE